MTAIVLAATAATEGCGWFDVPCVVKDWSRDVVETVGHGALEAVADSFLNGWAQLEMLFLSSWVLMPLIVDVSDPNGTVAWLQSSLATLTFWFAIMGALVAAGYTFLSLRGARMKDLGVRLLVLLLVSVAGAPLVAAVDRVAREASVWMLGQVGVGTEGLSMNNVTTTGAAGVAPAITLIVGIIAVIGVIAQWGIMIARGPLVVLLLGVWPLTSAVAAIGGQKATASFSHVTSWLLAFVIYPFPAAIVYAAAFKLKSGADGIGGMLYGLILEVLAILLLPSILRILAPQVQALGNAYGGTFATKAVAAAAGTAVAVGAAVVTAGAFTGLAAAKAGGAAGGKAAGSGAGSTAAGSSQVTPAGSSTSSSVGTAQGGAGAATDTSSTRGQGDRRNVGDDSRSGASGARTQNAASPAPSAATPGDRTPAGASAANATPAAATDAPRDRPVTPDAPAAPATRRGSRGGFDARAVGYGAQAIAGRVGPGAREALDDMDEVVGGKNV